MLFRVRTGKQGLELRLHELEAAVMDVVWGQRLTAFAVGDLLSVMAQQRDIAYTTLMTTLSRLHDKGLLDRERDGKRYLYTPALSREQFLESTAREVLEGAVASPQAMAMLAERVSAASAHELDELEAIIQRRREALA